MNTLLLTMLLAAKPAASVPSYQPCVWPNTCAVETIMPPCPDGLVCVSR